MADAGIGAGAPVLAFDVGGTDIKSALFDAAGAPRGLRRTPTPDGVVDPAVLTGRLRELAAELRAAHPDVVPEAVGLVVPGIVDDRAGVAVYSANLGWRGAPLRAHAAAAFGLPVAFDHDVRAGSWAEHALGAAREVADAVVVIIGTGIAGALILDGRPYTSGGYAGEIGHAPVAAGSPGATIACGCGARGCLEAVASAGAIVRRYAAETGADPDGAKDVIARAASGDAVAARIWDDALEALSLSLAQLTSVFAPQAIIIGGGLSRAGHALFDELRARLSVRLSFHRLPALVPAQLGEDAGILGAALRAREASHRTETA